MLLSASFDRTVKLWSLDDGAYVDTLFGHQSQVLAVDVLRNERAVSCGHDHTCRVWKIPEETQLVFRWVDGAAGGAAGAGTGRREQPGQPACVGSSLACTTCLSVMQGVGGRSEAPPVEGAGSCQECPTGCMPACASV
jgi:hypothetical protein